MSRYTFKMEDKLDERTVTVEFETVQKEEARRMFYDFLAGCGFFVSEEEREGE